MWRWLRRAFVPAVLAAMGMLGWSVPVLADGIPPFP